MSKKQPKKHPKDCLICHMAKDKTIKDRYGQKIVDLQDNDIIRKIAYDIVENHDKLAVKIDSVMTVTRPLLKSKEVKTSRSMNYKANKHSIWKVGKTIEWNDIGKQSNYDIDNGKQIMFFILDENIAVETVVLGKIKPIQSNPKLKIIKIWRGSEKYER